MPFPFEKKYLKESYRQIRLGAVKNVLFARGTYQVEIADLKSQQSFWPFLQIDESGILQDGFCTCTMGKKGGCLHLSIAFLFVHRKRPLHVRFLSSFWNALCFTAFTNRGEKSRRVEREKRVIFQGRKKGDAYSIQSKTRRGDALLDKILFHRVPETESNSLKFSNLPARELALWRRGTPSRQFQYELSFWSDLAKWMMLEQEFQHPYAIDYSSKRTALPDEISTTFSDIVCTFSLERRDWPALIPPLKKVRSPLAVSEFREIQLEEIGYDPKRRELHILSHPTRRAGAKGIAIGEWEYIPDIGFLPSQTSDLFKNPTIPAHQIGPFLTKEGDIAEKYLVKTPIHREPITPSYSLYFDQKGALHISSYLFAIGDLQAPSTAFFEPWVYLQNRGFFSLKDRVFQDVETIVPSDGMEEFIARHRLWLNKQRGFQIHPSNIEAHLSYRFDGSNLSFRDALAPNEKSHEIIDFGKWLYIRGKGFYEKQRGEETATIRKETRISRTDIPAFISSHREKLEQIKGFFSPIYPVEKRQVKISLDANGAIVVTPHYIYHPAYRDRDVDILETHTYVAGEGFAEIPTEEYLRKRYGKETRIEEGELLRFLREELPQLRESIFEIDPRLIPPTDLVLKVDRIDTTLQKSQKRWTADLSYKSPRGEAHLGLIKEKIDLHAPYAITEAGLIDLEHPRFHWLQKLEKSCISPDGKRITLPLLAWIELSASEEIEAPAGRESTETRIALEKIETFTTEHIFEAEESFSLDGLQSELRPYQTAGLKWLWSIYSLGLSALLCDDMGLGKTHQAMALLAAVHNTHSETQRCHFVVCPTSVIDHWVALLQKFLPAFQLMIFYGAKRFAHLNRRYDLLITSYGTLRREREVLSRIDFDVAIFDEIQIAKNTRSQIHKILLNTRAQTKIGLTGTPIENSLDDLKALFEIILPHYLPKRMRRENAPTHSEGEKRKIARLIHPFILRRKKSEVLDDLPEKIEEIRSCSLSQEQKELYARALASHKEMIEGIRNGKEEISYPHVFSLIHTLKQICDHPCLITKDLDRYASHKSGKWELFLELLREALSSEQKLVVFTQYLNMMHIIELYLKERGIGYAAIRGSTRNRKKQLDAFQNDPRCAVFIASLKAAGMGIDLTAASVVIHYDRWWNPAWEEQATDRVHRIGQSRGVQVCKIITENTIEESIHHIIQKKLSLLEGVVGYDDQVETKKLTREEILSLFT